MKRGKQIDAWYPFFIDKWLFGSTRHELIINPSWSEKYPDLPAVVPASVLQSPFTDLRGIFQDLMTLSKKDGGFIRANETTPYPVEQLAGMFCVPVDHVRATINICLHKKIGKLTEPSPGIYYITSTEVYALSRTRKNQVEAPHQPMPPGLSLPRAIRCPKKFETMRMTNGLVRLSRLIAAIAIQRSLSDDEEVHHINTMEEDDRVDNLMLFSTHRDHLRFQHGHTIDPLWDGRHITEKTKDILSAELSALGVDKTALYYILSSNILFKDGGLGEGGNKKGKTYPDDFQEEDIRLVSLLIELMLKNNPESSIIKHLTLEGRSRWADVSRKLREIDGQSPAKIETVIRFSQEDPFWSSNILSMPTLREKWDQLVMKSRRIRSERGDRVGAHRPVTASEKDISRKVEEYAKSLWSEAEPGLEEARRQGQKAFAEASERAQQEIEHKLVEHRKKLISGGHS